MDDGASSAGDGGEVRDALLRYLSATSRERARLIGQLVERNPGMAEVLMDLEADYELRTRLEIQLLRGEAPNSGEYNQQYPPTLVIVRLSAPAPKSGTRLRFRRPCGRLPTRMRALVRVRALCRRSR